ncbi:unnamed protein product [Protopolystoma xenopodis]|uniref:Uncharacterized protein n=1 Tax=Protopolystoma xenopodis TaxID=117903 RepID=A0A448WBK1_9PLAT|nr:unnamed protein product [Protopolystoma xenopodis]
MLTSQLDLAQSEEARLRRLLVAQEAMDVAALAALLSPQPSMMGTGINFTAHPIASVSDSACDLTRANSIGICKMAKRTSANSISQSFSAGQRSTSFKKPSHLADGLLLTTSESTMICPTNLENNSQCKPSQDIASSHGHVQSDPSLVNSSDFISGLVTATSAAEAAIRVPSASSVARSLANNVSVRDLMSSRSPQARTSISTSVLLPTPTAFAGCLRQGTLTPLKLHQSNRAGELEQDPSMSTGFICRTSPHASDTLDLPTKSNPTLLQIAEKCYSLQEIGSVAFESFCCTCGCHQDQLRQPSVPPGFEKHIQAQQTDLKMEQQHSPQLHKGQRNADSSGCALADGRMELDRNRSVKVDNEEHCTQELAQLNPKMFLDKPGISTGKVKSDACVGSDPPCISNNVGLTPQCGVGVSDSDENTPSDQGLISEAKGESIHLSLVRDRKLPDHLDRGKAKICKKPSCYHTYSRINGTRECLFAGTINNQARSQVIKHKRTFHDRSASDDDDRNYDDKGDGVTEDDAFAVANSCEAVVTVANGIERGVNDPAETSVSFSVQQLFQLLASAITVLTSANGDGLNTMASNRIILPNSSADTVSFKQTQSNGPSNSQPGYSVRSCHESNDQENVDHAQSSESIRSSLTSTDQNLSRLLLAAAAAVAAATVQGDAAQCPSEVKARVPGRGIQMHEKLSAQARMRYVMRL